MKGRITLVLLGMVAVGQEAAAQAHLTNEQRFQVGSVEMSLGVGLLNGKSHEKVYDEGEKLSQLKWDLKQVPTLHLGLAYYPLNWLSLEARGWTQIAKGNGHMKDYDWMNGEDEDWTHYSDHPDTRVQKAWQAEVGATAWALKLENLALGVMLGYQRSELGWRSRGGRFNYSSDDGFRDLVGQFPAGLKTITYEQTYQTPYVGLVALYTWRDWTLEGRFKHSQWVKASDYDQHHLRNLTFAGNNGNSGRMQSLAVGLGWQINPAFSIEADVDYQVYAEAKGSMRVNDLSSGETSYYSGDVGSQSSRTVVSSLAVNYRF